MIRILNADEKVGGMFISRRDIATFMLDAVSDTSYDGWTGGVFVFGLDACSFS